MTNKFIFLDIDGPMKPGRCYLCPVRAADMNGGWDPLAVAAINRMCSKTGAEIVFNTTWNKLNITDIAIAQGITAPIAGKTGYPYQLTRLQAITHWIEDNNQQDCIWIALDDVVIDDARAILICSENGITAEDYREATEKLGNPDKFMVLV